jgi:phosphoserine aminotransferase
MNTPKPTHKPQNPNFSSGPCAKRPGWSVSALSDTPVGRSHRAKIGKAKLQEAIDRTRSVLHVPADYKIGIVPASDTGAVEMAMWSMLGARGVDMVAWESFGEGWVTDAVKQLKLSDCRTITAPYGELPDLSKIDTQTRDVVFTWNGTTSGVRTPNGDWISDTREGVTICDATSAAFAQDLPWAKLDVVTYSWQKVILPPRAVDRLETYKPAWPLPKIFRLTKGGKLIDGIFVGETINTPSMLCVEDYLDALKWAESLGGLSALRARADKNAATLDAWVQRTPWVGHLAVAPDTRSNTSVCLTIQDPDVLAKGNDTVAKVAKGIVSALEKEGVAFDIGAYRDAPAGLRIWCGATVETSDIEALTPWLDWAFGEQKAALG